MLSDRNLFPRTDELRRFCVPPHTPLSAPSRRAASSVPWSDTTTSDIAGSGSIGEAEFVAANIERTDSPSIRMDTPAQGRWDDARGTWSRSKAPRLRTVSTETSARSLRTTRAIRFMSRSRASSLSSASPLTRSGLVQNEDVRERDLLGALVASPELLLDVGCIDERYDPVKRELRANFVVHEEGLSDRTGIGEPCGLHQHIVELVAALHEVAEHTKIRSPRTVQQMQPFDISKISSSALMTSA